MVGQLSFDPLTTFKPVDPARLTFSGNASFDPRPFLDPICRELYERPLENRLEPGHCAERPPRVRVHCSLASKIKLFELLDASGRLDLHPRAAVTPGFGNGLFAVTKDLTKDRLVLDARPANLLEQPPGRWIGTLAGGEALVKLQLREGEVLKCSGSDLRDYYYLFKVSQSRSRKNVLVGALPTNLLTRLKACSADVRAYTQVYGSLKSLAMGDSLAVEFGQTAHLGIGVQSGILHPHNLMTYQTPLPRVSDFFGLVIDDFVGFSICQADSTGPTPAAEATDQMEQAYKRVGLIPRPSKSFRDEEEASFWGADIDGKRGIVRGSLKRAVPLAGLLFRVAIISLFLYRRRLLSILDGVFQSFQHCSSHAILKLDSRTKSDPLLAAVLLPLAATNLRARLSERVTATDASDWGEAGACASLPGSLAQEAYRSVLRKSVWARLLGPAKAWLRGKGLLDVAEELPDGRAAFKPHPVWSSLAECLQYTLLHKRAKRRSRHINIGEVQAVLKAEEIHGSRRPSSREIYAIDSQVALAIFSCSPERSQFLSCHKQCSVFLAALHAG